MKKIEELVFNTWEDFLQEISPSIFRSLNHSDIDGYIENEANIFFSKLGKNKVRILNASLLDFISPLYGVQNYYSLNNFSQLVTLLKDIKFIFQSDISIQGNDLFPLNNFIFEGNLEILGTKKLKICQTTIKGSIKIRNCEDIELDTSILEKEITIIGSYKNLKILESDIDTLNFESQTNKEGLGKVEIKNTSFKKLNIKAAFFYIYNSKKLLKNSENIDFTGLKGIIVNIGSPGDESANNTFGTISFSEMNMRGTVIQNTSINILKFLDCNISDEELLLLENIEVKKELILLNTDLKNSTFNGIVIKQLSFNNTNFTKCIINGVTFKNYTLGNMLEGKIINVSKLKDNYRQLKHIMDESGNHTEANKFFSKEMEYYGKTLSFGGDKVLFFIQKITSDFGNSWIQPLLLIIVFSNISLLIRYGIDFGNFEIKFFYFKDYLNLFAHNLTPFSELIKGDNTSFVKLIYNLIIIFLVYHFTIALKRTTKR